QDTAPRHPGLGGLRKLAHPPGDRPAGLATRLGLGQRQDLGDPAGSGRRETVHPANCLARNRPPWRPAMTSTVRTFVALDDGVSRAEVEAALPYDATFQIVGILEGLQESWATLEETEVDVVLIACAGHSERALLFIDNAIKQQPDRPVIVLLDGEADGFVRRAFEAGADDLVALPATSAEIRFALEKGLARKSGSAGPESVGTAPMIVG